MKQKIMVGILVMLMITVSLVGVFNTGVKAFDTNPQPFGEIPGPAGTYDVYGVAWNDAGSYAMLVGDNYAAGLDWYDYQKISNISGLSANTVLNDVVYDSFSGKFYAVGQDVSGTGVPVAYEWSPGSASMTSLPGTGSSGQFFRVAMGEDGFMAVGAYETSLAMYYNITSATWQSITVGGGYELRAVSYVNGSFFLFESASQGTDVYVITENEAKNGGTASFVESLPDLAGTYDSATNGDDITVVGFNNSGDGFVFTFYAANGSIEFPLMVTTSSNQDGYTLYFKSIAWDLTGSWAVIVGYEDYSGSPVVYKYNDRGMYVARLSSYDGSATDLFGVAVRPPHSPSSATIVGSGTGGVTTLSTTTATQQVTANTIYPHINYIDIYDNSSNSYMNRQMNVDEGAATDEFYYVEVDAYYGDAVSGLSWADIDTVDVYAWYDGGNLGASSVYGAEVAGNENLQFHFQYDNSTGTPAWSIQYPVSGEVQFFPSVCSEQYVNDFERILQFAFAPQQQVHNGSAGQEGANTAPDNRYSATGTWVAESQSTINALNDPYTWDMHVRVVDTTGSAFADAYDEFGIYKFTDLGTWSIPGDLSASAAPSTTGVILQQGSNPTFDLTYRSNCEYQIRVYMDDNLRSGTTTDIIYATALTVFGGNMSKALYFQGIGVTNAIYIVGNVTAVAPESSGTSTTTSQVGAPLQWTVDIPAVDEASYTANAVYEILHP